MRPVQNASDEENLPEQVLCEAPPPEDLPIRLLHFIARQDHRARIQGLGPKVLPGTLLGLERLFLHRMRPGRALCSGPQTQDSLPLQDLRRTIILPVESVCG